MQKQLAELDKQLYDEGLKQHNERAEIRSKYAEESEKLEAVAQQMHQRAENLRSKLHSAEESIVSDMNTNVENAEEEMAARLAAEAHGSMQTRLDGLKQQLHVRMQVEDAREQEETERESAETLREEAFDQHVLEETAKMEEGERMMEGVFPQMEKGAIPQMETGAVPQMETPQEQGISEDDWLKQTEEGIQSEVKALIRAEVESIVSTSIDERDSFWKELTGLDNETQDQKEAALEADAGVGSVANEAQKILGDNNEMPL